LAAPEPEPSPGFVPEAVTPALVPPVASGVGAVVDPVGPTEPVLPMPVVLVLLLGVVTVVDADAVLGVVTVVLDVRSLVRIVELQPAASAAAMHRARRGTVLMVLPCVGAEEADDGTPQRRTL
jgi:hypothetical protein